MTEEQTQKKQQHDLQQYKLLMEAFSYPNLNIGTNQTLYHYTDAAGLLGILKPEAPVLWFSRFDCLNDKSEGQDILEHFQNACQFLKKSKEFDSKLLNAILKCTPSDNVPIAYNLQDEIDLKPLAPNEDMYNRTPIGIIGNFESEVFMCCFSKRNDLLPMWNYYTNGSIYQGYCIGFDPHMFLSTKRYAHNSDETKIDGCNTEVIKVIYDNEEKKKILDKRIRAILTISKNYGYDINTQKNYITSMLNSLHFVFKNPVFSYEEEVRVIIYRPKNDPKVGELKLPQIEYRTKRGIIIPYIQLRMNDCKTRVKCVTVGPLIERDVALQTTKDFLSQRDYDAKVQESQVPIR